MQANVTTPTNEKLSWTQFRFIAKSKGTFITETLTLAPPVTYDDVVQISLREAAYRSTMIPCLWDPFNVSLLIIPV